MTEERSTAWREANRGTAIKETARGLTYLEFSPWRITALRPAPATAWVKHEDQPRWRGTAVPDISLGDLIRNIHAERRIMEGTPRKAIAPSDRPPARPYESRRRKNFARFLQEVPAAVEAELAQRYPRRDWRLFRLLLSSPEAREACALGDRALVFALTEARFLLQTPPRDRVAFASRWLRRPRRKALARIGFPDRPLSVTVLGKLLPAHADGEVLLAVREALLHEVSAKALAHVSRVNAAVALLAQPDILSRVTPGLLESQALVEDRWEAVAAHRMLIDTVSLEAQLDVGARPRFATLEALQAHHDHLAEVARRGKLASDVPFPLSPVQLTDDERTWIIPLKDGRALVNEGTSMQHCLGTLTEHHRLAQQGRFYAWALCGDQRATVALIRRDQEWQLYDARGVANTRPSEEVAQWSSRLVRRANAALGARRMAQETLLF